MLCALALTLAAVPAPQEAVELESPWFAELALTLEVERRVERLGDGTWATVGGERSTIDVRAVRQTEGGHWLLDATARDSRSLLTDAADDLAHRVAGLADGVTCHFLCDDYGVPDTVVETEATVAELRARRTTLVDELRPTLGALAGELVPTPESIVARWLELGDAWCVPIGYFLVEDDPLSFEYYEAPTWSIITSTRDITYRLETVEPGSGVHSISCDDRPRAQDSALTDRLAGAGLSSAQPLGPVIRTNWTFDRGTGLPTLARRVTLERLGKGARRDTLTVRVVAN